MTTMLERIRQVCTPAEVRVETFEEPTSQRQLLQQQIVSDQKHDEAAVKAFEKMTAENRRCVAIIQAPYKLELAHKRTLAQESHKRMIPLVQLGPQLREYKPGKSPRELLISGSEDTELQRQLNILRKKLADAESELRAANSRESEAWGRESKARQNRIEVLGGISCSYGNPGSRYEVYEDDNGDKWCRGIGESALHEANIEDANQRLALANRAIRNSTPGNDGSSAIEAEVSELQEMVSFVEDRLVESEV